jgi:hypothetical protein
MSEFLERPSATPNNPSMLHMLQRHKDIAFDYNKELRKVKVKLTLTGSPELHVVESFTKASVPGQYTGS